MALGRRAVILGAAGAAVLVVGGEEVEAQALLTGETDPYEKPGFTNTGIIAGSALTAVTGNQVITTPGASFISKHFQGFVDVKAAGVTFINCRFSGGAGPLNATRGLVNAHDVAVKSLRFIHCTFRPSSGNESPYLHGLLGHDFLVEHSDFSNTVDGIGVYNTHAPGQDSKVVIQNNWIHDLTYYSPFSGHSDNQTHNDCIQLQGGLATVIRNNALDAKYATGIGTGTQPVDRRSLTCLMLNNNVGRIGDLIVENNWFSGSYLPVNGGGCAKQDAAHYLGRFRRNQFEGDQMYGDHTLDFDTTWASGGVDAFEGTPDANWNLKLNREVVVRRNQ